MDIKKTFINLTKFTYTHGNEFLLEKYLPSGFEKDEFDNYFYKIGDSDTMFTCHLDTATSKFKIVNHIFENNFIKTDGTTILGADDKAGMTIILYMISKEIPGLYYFFIGEEVGCIGSGNAATLDFSKYKKCVSFDRRGYGSVITHQLRGRCCSPVFADKLSEELTRCGLPYSPDSTGIMTDSAMFVDQIPECTNISVGYFKEHTLNESQDILYLKELCQVCTEVNWDQLPIERDPFIYDKYFFDDVNEEKEYESAKLKVWVGDYLYLVKLTSYRIIDENKLIYDWVSKTGSYAGLLGISWNGKSCYVQYDEYNEYIGDREDIIQVIESINYIPLNDMIILKRIK